jgi:hypothetical protein
MRYMITTTMTLHTLQQREHHHMLARIRYGPGVWPRIPRWLTEAVIRVSQRSCFFGVCEIFAWTGV